MDTLEPKPQSNTLGIIGLVTGILSILFAFCCNVFGILLGIIAIIFGALANKEKQNFATAGIVLGIIGLILSIVMLFVGIAFFPWEEFYNLY